MGFGCRLSGFWFWVLGSGLRVSGFGFRVETWCQRHSFGHTNGACGTSSGVPTPSQTTLYRICRNIWRSVGNSRNATAYCRQYRRNPTVYRVSSFEVSGFGFQVSGLGVRPGAEDLHLDIPLKRVSGRYASKPSQPVVIIAGSILGHNWRRVEIAAPVCVK